MPQSQQCQIWAAPSAATYTTAHGNAESLTNWTRPGIKPASSWILVGFLTTEPQQELLIWIFLNKRNHMTNKNVNLIISAVWLGTSVFPSLGLGFLSLKWAECEEWEEADLGASSTSDSILQVPMASRSCVPGPRHPCWWDQFSPWASRVCYNCFSLHLISRLLAQLRQAFSQSWMASTVVSINPSGRDSPFLAEWVMFWALPWKRGPGSSILVTSKLSSYNLTL